ncbi:MAG: ABC transporter substrate-binding protein, partial [Candidatus Bathyarchaeia archaeon]
MAKEALTKIQAVIIAVVVIIAVILGAFAYTMMTPPATPTPATPTPATPTPATPTPATPTPATPTPATPSISEIRIGTVQHLSGALSPFIDGFRGIVMGVNWINAHGGINFNGQKVPLKLVFYDDETNKDYAIKLYEKLIAEDKVHILIPPWTPEYILATVPVSERYKMVAIGCG